MSALYRQGMSFSGTDVNSTVEAVLQRKIALRLELTRKERAEVFSPKKCEARSTAVSGEGGERPANM